MISQIKSIFIKVNFHFCLPGNDQSKQNKKKIGRSSEIFQERTNSNVLWVNIFVCTVIKWIKIFVFL